MHACLPELGSHAVLLGLRHSCDVYICVSVAFLLKKAVPVKLLDTKPWQILPLLAMASHAFASLPGSVLSCIHALCRVILAFSYAASCTCCIAQPTKSTLV